MYIECVALIPFHFVLIYYVLVNILMLVALYK